ncbi:MAG: hypothetical protein CMJ83_05410 [Planctomycetes bacterium]|nr:hypothetical protein [Planctomycetota bacterium]
MPGGLTVAGLIGTLYVDLASTYWVFPVAPPFNIPLTTAVVCTTAYAQWAFPCGPQWVLSDALQLDLSAP